MSDTEFWVFLTAVVPCLLVPIAIAWWKGRGLIPIAVLSLVFWPGALVLALRLPRRGGKDQRRVQR